MSEPTPYAAAPAGAKTNVLAIVSLITSIVGLSLIGIITGHISLGQIKRTGESGHGLALAGTILGYVGLVIGLIVGLIVILFYGTLFATSGVISNYGY
jgi:uncharacterized membrane protein YjfL (UPF0719 family)